MEYIAIYETQNCGVKEIDDLYLSPNAKSVVEDVAEFFFEEDEVAFYIFTDVSTSKRGKNLEAFIKKNELGPVVKTASVKNPNTDNSITVWVWQVNKKNLEKFYKEEEDPDWN